MYEEKKFSYFQKCKLKKKKSPPTHPLDSYLKMQLLDSGGKTKRAASHFPSVSHVAVPCRALSLALFDDVGEWDGGVGEREIQEGGDVCTGSLHCVAETNTVL